MGRSSTLTGIFTAAGLIAAVGVMAAPGAGAQTSGEPAAFTSSPTISATRVGLRQRPAGVFTWLRRVLAATSAWPGARKESAAPG